MNACARFFLRLCIFRDIIWVKRKGRFGMLFTASDFGEHIDKSGFQAAFSRDALREANNRLDDYNQELDKFVVSLRAAHNYDDLMEQIERLTESVAWNEFVVRFGQFCLTVDAIFKLVRANPSSAIAEVSSICDEFPISISWRVENQPETGVALEHCFDLYTKQIFSEEYRRAFFESGEHLYDTWRIGTSLDLPKVDACMTVKIPVLALDGNLPYIREIIDSRTEEAAVEWATDFSKLYIDDVHKRRALYESLRKEFEKKC